MYSDKKKTKNLASNGATNAQNLPLLRKSYANLTQVSAINMKTTELFLDTRRQLNDGTYPIMIKVGYGSNLYLPTRFYARREDWDAVAQRVTARNSGLINGAITSMLSAVVVRLIELRSTGVFERLNRAQLKALLTDLTADASKVAPPSTESVGAVFERLIATKSPGNAKVLQGTLDKLAGYCDVFNLSFNDVNRSWLLDFQAHFSHLAVNSLSIHLRNIRAVFNYAIDEEITSNYPFRKFKIRNEETEKRALPIESMRFYAAAEGLNEFYREYRDMFMLIFYLVGINMVDLSRLRHENYRQGRINYRRAKTGKLYSIKVEPEAAEIIERYRGESHLLRCFDRYGYYKDYLHRINDAMKRLGPLVPTPPERRRRGVARVTMQPIEPEVTTYWARHSWATYAADLDIPKDTISEALGHEYGCRTTGIYIKFSRDKIDAANRRVIDWVLYGRR